MATVTITGAKELQAKLAKLPKKVANKIQRQGIRKGAKIIQEEARRLVPRKSGLLRKSIKVRVPKKKRRGEIIISVQTGSLGDFKGKSFYGAFVEYGTSKMAARPFMRPAADNKKQAATDAIVQSIREGIREATGA